jgi:hypothetical protein
LHFFSVHPHPHLLNLQPHEQKSLHAQPQPVLQPHISALPTLPALQPHLHLPNSQPHAQKSLHVQPQPFLQPHISALPALPALQPHPQLLNSQPHLHFLFCFGGIYYYNILFIMFIYING